MTAKIKIYKILDNAITDGILFGIHRTYKHSDQSPPDKEIERLRENLRNEIWAALDEVVEFENPPISVKKPEL